MEAKLQGPEGRDDQHCNEVKRRVSDTLPHAAASHFGWLFDEAADDGAIVREREEGGG